MGLQWYHTYLYPCTITVPVMKYFAGKVMNEDDISDHMPYTTLMFTNGQGFNYTWNGTEVSAYQ